MGARLLDAGDAAVTVEFGDQISADLVARVAALQQALDAARESGALPGVVETVPTFRSLTVIYDPLLTRRALIDPVLRALLVQTSQAMPAAGRRWRLPACYGSAGGDNFGADLGDVAAATGLSPEAVVQMHSSTVFSVYVLGFMPGFAFMGGLPAALQMPRRREPRLRVPAGSVAIAGSLTGIYPWQSPGGWQLVGRCPVPMFDAALTTPALLAPGDSVRFEPVSAERCADLLAMVRAGRFDTRSLLETA